MLFYSDAEPLSICAVIGPDHTHCVQIGFSCTWICAIRRWPFASDCA